MASASKTMTRREARKWIREHYANWVFHSDCPGDMPEECNDVWQDEKVRCARKLGFLYRDERAAVSSLPRTEKP